MPGLPASKSECNRALMLSAYSKGKIKVENISEANDSQILHRLLQHDGPVFDAEDAGTCFRFLTTYLAITRNQSTLTGTSRMKQRPIGLLVDALRNLGAKIEYSEIEGFPPLLIQGLGDQLRTELTMDASVSSQYITSLMLAAPFLPDGLRLQFSNQVSSASYISLTWDMMQRLGFKGELTHRGFDIPPQICPTGTILVESDWSALCYWLAFAAIFKGPVDLCFSNVYSDSKQGDAGFLNLVKLWGVEGHFNHQKFQVSRKGPVCAPERLEVDLNLMPDQAQTLIALCASSGVEAQIAGLKSLAIKETNRLRAMQQELEKVGVSMEVDEGLGTCFLPGRQALSPPNQTFKTYEDHRMAMSLSLMSLVFPEGIKIENPDVVRKSYPGFWAELANIGFQLS